MARFGAYCPDGHGALLSGDSWGDRLYCPSLEHGGNGQFFEHGNAESNFEPVKVGPRRPKPEPIDEPGPGIAALVRAAQAARLTKPKKEQAVTRTRTAGDPRPCECKCGGQTKGGRFLPGHDARYHGAEKRIAAGIGTDADRAMVAP